MNHFRDIYDEILHNLENDINFHFVRYGDGEWGMILRNYVYKNLIKKWGNSLEPFCEILKNIVDSKPKYYFGIQDLSYNNWKDELDELTKDMNLVRADIFHHRSQKNNIKKFFNTLSEKKNIILIGPHYLNEIKEFGIRHHIVTQQYHVWENIDKIEKEVSEYIDKNEEKNLILIYCCSIVAKILIDKFSIKKITQIDLGSLLDPYVGMNSRSYHKLVLDRIGFKESEIKVPKIK